MDRVYLETTIPSYLTSWPSQDVIMSANQQLTRQWWDQYRTRSEIFISQLVRSECTAGDADAARRRLELLEGIPVLELTADAVKLATELVDGVPLPPKAKADALHIALAAVNAMDYLLTWNCTHIANVRFRNPIRIICEEHGFGCPVICTPADFVRI